VLTLNKDGISATFPAGESRGTWQAYALFRETADLFLLFRLPWTYTIIPKRAMSPAEVKELRAHLPSGVSGTVDSITEGMVRAMFKIGGITFLSGLLVFGIVAFFVWGLDACRWLTRASWETAPLPNAAPERVKLKDLPGLRVDRVRFYSQEMRAPRFFLALVPKTAEPLDEVFILSHGWFDRPEFLIEHLHVDLVYEKLLASGQVRPALIIMPDVRFTEYFRRHSEHYPFPQYLTLVAEEAAGTASREYNIPFRRDKWSLGGFSFGGYLSLDIARRYSGLFHSVSVVSSFADRDWAYWPEKNPPPGVLDAQGRGKQTIVKPGPMPDVFLACGTGDRFFKQMEDLHEKFTQLGIPHQWSTGPGGHTWQYWSTALEPMLKFHLGVRAAALAPGPRHMLANHPASAL
jgi:enterochelin esterase-like enzyme